MRITPTPLWLAVTYMVSGARALPRPHPVATYQVVDVGGSTSSSSVPAEVVYETVAITKSSKPKTVTESPVTITESPVTVTLTPTISTTPSTSSSTIASSSTTVSAPARISTSSSTPIAKSPLPTISLPTSTWSPPLSTWTPTTTSEAAYAPETIKSWTPTSSAVPYVATSVAVYTPAQSTTWSEAPAKTEVSPLAAPTSTWSPSATTAMHTVFETVYVPPFTFSSPFPTGKSAFPAFVPPWNATRYSAKATHTGFRGHSSGLSSAASRQTGVGALIHM